MSSHPWNVPKVLKMTQVIVAPWKGDKGLTYSTLALGEDGAVYRYDPGCNGWIRYSMVVADCGIEGHRR